MNRKANLKMRVLILLLVAAITGAVWNVSTVYGQAQPDYPFDGDIIIGDTVTYLGDEYIWTKLIFFPDASAVKHTGYFSDDYNEVAGRVQDANLGAPPYASIPGWEYTLFAGNPQVPPADYTLARGTRYYWTVDATDALGNQFPGDIWEFAIQGFHAFAPNPPNEAIFVETDVLLSWVPGFSVEDHDIYMGTSWEDVNNSVYSFTTPPPEFLGTTSEASLLVTGLTEGVKYYWRVDQVNGRMPYPIGGGTYYRGDVWCFTTIPEGLGSIREDLWWGIAGREIEDLLNDPRYPDNPDETRYLTSFESGTSLGESYGGQIHGWLHPRKSGDYTFWLASDDESELFLSTDDTPANKVGIAHIINWTTPYEWYKSIEPYQESSPISLVGGEKYYIMARWKEHLGGDFCMVAWQGPDQPLAPVNGSASAVIPGNRLSPFAQLWAHNPDPCDGQVSVESPVTLRWGPGDNADEHDVYVGTDQALVESRAPSVYKGRIDSNSYNLGHVFSGMIYYWAIDEVEDSGPEPGIWQGDVWSFTTVPAPIFVDVDATGANDGSNWADAYNSLQDGLAKANSSMKPVEIRVAQGIYKPTPPPPPPPPGAPPLPFDRTATFQLINNVTVNGGYTGFGEPDPNVRDIELYETILSGDLAGNDVDVNNLSDLWDELSRAENSYHVVTGSETDETAVLDGFTVTAGNASRSSPSPHAEGGGMYNDEGIPTVTNCIITGNSARRYGGGIYCIGSGPTIANCIIRGNLATQGGGIFAWENSSPRITGCTVSGNSSGVYCWRNSSLDIEDSIISTTGRRGIYCGDSPAVSIVNCTISSNQYAGIRYDGYGPLVINNCTIFDNQGPGIQGSVESTGTGTISNCVISGNNASFDGGGIRISTDDQGLATITNCTITGNIAIDSFGNIGRGGGVSCSRGNIIITNSIIWNNIGEDIYVWNYPPPPCQDCTVEPTEVAVSYSCTGQIIVEEDPVFGDPNLILGAGNIDADPCFVQPGYWDINIPPLPPPPPPSPLLPASSMSDTLQYIWIEGDYHLLPYSVCIDAGDPCYVPEPNEMDLDGRPRVIGGRIDMGAYEFFNTQPVGDAGDDQGVECACNTAEGTKVTLDGSGSYDVDGDALTYSWMGPFTESPADGAAPTVTLEDGCPGDYVITLIVNDGTEDSEPNEVKITVVDTTPPEFTFSVTPTMLWPPNKKMVKITHSWTLSDNCDATPDVSLVSVSMNESETRSNVHTDDDIQIGDDGTIYVRAKRNRSSDRIYTITYQAIDGSGNETEKSATVTVQRKKR